MAHRLTAPARAPGTFLDERRALLGDTWLDVPRWRLGQGRQPLWGGPCPAPTAEEVWASVLDTVLYECDPGTGAPVFTLFVERPVPRGRGGQPTRVIFQWTLGAPDQCGLWQVARKALKVRPVWVPAWNTWVPQIAMVGSAFMPLPCPWWRPGEQHRSPGSVLAGPLDPEVLARFAHPDPWRRFAVMAEATPAIWL